MGQGSIPDGTINLTRLARSQAGNDSLLSFAKLAKRLLGTGAAPETPGFLDWTWPGISSVECARHKTAANQITVSSKSESSAWKAEEAFACGERTSRAKARGPRNRFPSRPMCSPDSDWCTAQPDHR